MTRLALFPTTRRLALTTVYRQSEGKCVATPLGDEPYEVFEAPAPLTEIDPAVFVELTATDDVPDTGERLRASRQRFDGADGSRWFGRAAIYDGQRKELCQRRRDANGEGACLPDGPQVQPTRTFADPECKVAAFDVLDARSCITDPRNRYDAYMQRIDRDACSRTEIFPRFSTEPLAERYLLGATCTRYTPSFQSDAIRPYAGPLPAPVPPESFARLSSDLVDNPPAHYGRAGSRLTLERPAATTPSGALVLARAPTFYDTKLETPCSAKTLADGKEYCVGGLAASIFPDLSSALYADQACTQPLVGIAKQATACATEKLGKLPFVSRGPARKDECLTYRIYERPAVAAPEAVYAKSPDGTCRVTTAYSPALYDLFPPSSLVEVPPSTFVPLTSELMR